ANAGSLEGDIAALADFRLAADRSGALATWNASASPSPCGGTTAWPDALGLSGADALPALARLDGLRMLSLKGNRLSGAVPDLSPLQGLKLLFLSRNALSGAIPPSLGKLYRLYRLLSSNDLSGVMRRCSARAAAARQGRVRAGGAVVRVRGEELLHGHRIRAGGAAARVRGEELLHGHRVRAGGAAARVRGDARQGRLRHGVRQRRGREALSDAAPVRGGVHEHEHERPRRRQVLYACYLFEEMTRTDSW
uniref:Leucine-rich repeat-containing N-terminal plant-type domain-containing protein n=1 Tax=Aegilops tauschii subsp. strangulata TaxID=200361 RepID=A0A452ZXA0_AEGTS